MLKYTQEKFTLKSEDKQLEQIDLYNYVSKKYGSDGYYSYISRQNKVIDFTEVTNKDFRVLV